MAPCVPSKRPAEDEALSSPAKRQSSSPSNEVITSVLWTNPKDTVAGGHTVFPNLDPATKFESLREHLCAYTQILKIFDNRLAQNNMRRLFADQIVVLAINDYTCRTGKPGRMVHCSDHPKWNTKEQGMVVYFAGRGWSKAQQEYYNERTPDVRLKLSGLYAGYHWQDLNTSTLKARLLTDFKILGKVQCPKTIFYVPGKTMKEVTSSSGDELIILWVDERLLCTTLKDILSCPRLGRPNAEPDQQGLPRLNVETLRGCIKDHLQFHWWFVPMSKKCQDWAKEREITNSNLGEGLYKAMAQEFLKDGGDSARRDWRAARQAME